MATKVFIVDEYNQTKVVEMNHVPRVGDRVSWLYQPSPMVTTVTWLLPGTIYPRNIPTDVEVVVTL